MSSTVIAIAVDDEIVVILSKLMKNFRKNMSPVSTARKSSFKSQFAIYNELQELLNEEGEVNDEEECKNYCRNNNVKDNIVMNAIDGNVADHDLLYITYDDFLPSEDAIVPSIIDGEVIKSNENDANIFPILQSPNKSLFNNSKKGLNNKNTKTILEEISVGLSSKVDNLNTSIYNDDYVKMKVEQENWNTLWYLLPSFCCCSSSED